MKTILISLVLSFSFTSIIAQANLKDPDEFLRKGAKVPKVLLVGSFHFNYPGLDAHKISEEKKINIYSEKRQKELQELLNYISKFKPTKIMVETGENTGYLLKNYERYKNGEEKLRPNESSQIGMRLADRFALDTIYGVDAGHLMLDLYKKRTSEKPQNYIDSISDRHHFGGDDKFMRRYNEFYSYKDKVEYKNTLLKTFKYMNSDKVLDRGFGDYISGGQFISEEMEGPDALSMFWMNRNLRIFRKIQKINHNQNDRILVIFGAGHVSILKWLFKCTPEFELVKFNDL
ncbi:DUF5694 domain-containing protein [Zunongwangia sp. HGR-M22]|uniref:DUF5694 domain-containing protein n=1 Tax=Zunongwangia sp. HGR-M22 TaxID=3015168 RepID=UPI0022DD9D14|nr:DUF5694 domain-containing protein [Zunongwangia sp. HGR-M22]WBL25848.1 DUF5694 domain-containing protein [Zunongwangia sp. HGR-M22]